jgi:hypothetical protein
MGRTYCYEQRRPQLVVVGELVLNVLNIVGEGSQLVHFHEGASHHARCWRGPVGEYNLVAGKSGLRRAGGMVHRTTKGACDTRTWHVALY